MKKHIQKVIVSISVLMLSTVILQGAKDFKLVHRLTYKDQIYGYFRGSLIDSDNDIIVGFYGTPLRLFTPEKSIQFALMGQGPNQLTNLWAYCWYNNDLALFEMPNKIKIFMKKNDSYQWKETKWLKRGPFAHVPRGAVFFDNKWFIAGSNFHDMGGPTSKVSFVKIYGANGKPLKDLLFKQFKEPRMHIHMHYFILVCKNRVLYLPENELKVTVIDPTELKILKEVSLETPVYYKPMPPDFYILNDSGKRSDLLKALEYWKYSYSRISKVVVDENQLVLQFRIFDEERKKFALLFYNAENFKLEKTVFTDDCFLGARNGEYYFYANGDPGFDEEDADKCIINVYRFEDK